MSPFEAGAVSRAKRQTAEPNTQRIYFFKFLVPFIFSVFTSFRLRYTCFLLFLSIYSIVLRLPEFILEFIDCLRISKNIAASAWQINPFSFSFCSLYHFAKSVSIFFILIIVSFF